MASSEPPPPAQTFAYEDDLPRLPVPPLPSTCDRFLEWVEPLLTDDELTQTRYAMQEFRSDAGIGKQLQELLVRHDRTPGRATWADEFFHQRYFGRRTPVAINANYFFLFQSHPGIGQLQRAARLVNATLQFKQRVDDETLAPVTRRGQPMSMEQYKYLFSATRIPGEPLDSSRAPYTSEWPGPSRERHILVLHQGHAVTLDVLDENGTPYDVDEVETGLRAAVRACEDDTNGEWVGAFTTSDRPRWARNRQALIDAGNDEALDRVERALFCVCLDDVAPSSATQACDQLLHGNRENRWFDKAVSFIVAADGTAGFNGEHCRLDGTTVVGFLDVVLTATPAPSTGRDRHPRAEPVTFQTTPHLREELRAARASFDVEAAATLGVALAVDFSATRAKLLGVSPDAFAQLAFQLANFRATGEVGSTYESIATTGYRHGRTEAMRVVTPQSVKFVQCMDKPGVGDDERRNAFRAAAEQHGRRAAQCRAGDAPEQHLWELLMTHQRRRSGAIALFESPGWAIARDDRLSTSAVPSPHVSYWGFGPTNEQCLGVGYALLPDTFHLYISARHSQARRLSDFVTELPRVVEQIEELLRDHR